MSLPLILLWNLAFTCLICCKTVWSVDSCVSVQSRESESTCTSAVLFFPCVLVVMWSSLMAACLIFLWMNEWPHIFLHCDILFCNSVIFFVCVCKSGFCSLVWKCFLWNIHEYFGVYFCTRVLCKHMLYAKIYSKSLSRTRKVYHQHYLHWSMWKHFSFVLHTWHQPDGSFCAWLISNVLNTWAFTVSIRGICIM